MLVVVVVVVVVNGCFSAGRVLRGIRYDVTCIRQASETDRRQIGDLKII